MVSSLLADREATVLPVFSQGLPQREVGLPSALEWSFQESPGIWKFLEAPLISGDKLGLPGQSGFRHLISVLSPPLPPWLVGERKTPPSKVKILRMGASCCLNSYFAACLNLWSSSCMVLSFYLLSFFYYHCVFWLLFLCGVKFDFHKGRGSMRLDVF